MPSNKNIAVVACAGAGKTTLLVDRASTQPAHRVLLTTYTNENVAQIRQYITERHKRIPRNVVIEPWHTFLLREGVRPYQNQISAQGRVRSIFYPQSRNRFQKKGNYFTKEGDIYGDKLSEFVHDCNEASGGRVVGRLARIYSHILVDELQDFAGYDLEVLRGILRSSISVTLVGDPRQSTFSTNRSSKNRRFKKQGISEWIDQRSAAGELKLEYRTNSHRCNQRILDVADSLFPDLPRTTSASNSSTGHDGVFAIAPASVASYVRTHKPVVLRHNIRTDTLSIPAINIGHSKGRTYDRVLIFPTRPMIAFLTTGKSEDAGDRCRLYVAMTRARFSATFVVEEPSSLAWLNGLARVRDPVA